MGSKNEDLLLKVDYQHYLNVPRYMTLLNITLYILLGGRGIGKTTGIVNWCVKKAVEDENYQFVYVRRHKPETASSKDLLKPLLAHSGIKGTSVKGVYTFTYKDRVIGWAIPLSVQASVKSGFDFSKVQDIIYDEVGLMPGSNQHYLKDEPHHFFELVSTIVRTRQNYRAFLLSNNIDLFNPFIVYFNIPNFEKSYIDRDRQLYVEKCPTKEELLKLEQQTPLFSWTKGTTYADYHYNNKVLSSDRVKVIPKPKTAHLWYRIGYNNFTISFWLYWDNRDKTQYFCWVEQFKGLFDDSRIQLMVNDRPHKINVPAYKSSNEYKALLQLYFDGRCSFDRQETNTIVTTMFDMLK